MSDYLDKLEESEETKIPTPEDFFLKTNLYEKFEIDRNNENDIDRVIEIEFFNGAISCYCPECKVTRTFRNDLIKNKTLSTKTKPHNYTNEHHINIEYDRLKDVKKYIAFMKEIEMTENRTFTLEFYCTHNHDHRIYFTFTVQNSFIQKSGQFPTLLDLEDSTEITKYKKELGTKEGRNYHKAIGLASHGIGAGSYVYLRRIFEGFIYEAKDKAIKEEAITEDDFVPKKMNEKIELLKDYLPEILVEHKEYYSVVSKGIHELSEDECLKYFNVLKDGIEVILDEKIETRKKEEKRKAFKSNMNETHKEIKADS
ncbi:hypothetical protein [Arcobacter aquimarinus]|uniref:hypothetical protein n=1 Tax=Arcobacter aquimarinus TaxID=1315211 RepID=UPI003BAF46D2